MSAMESKLLIDFCGAVGRRYVLLTEKGQPKTADTVIEAMQQELDYRTDDEAERDRCYARAAVERRRL